MKKGFVFERNLPHQTQAVESIIKVFENLSVEKPKGEFANLVNPTIDYHSPAYQKNINALQKENQIAFEASPAFTNVLDIMMETGTGKTYTYTKAMFELNKNYGIFKFIIVVPTLSIKAGTKNFLKSDSAREHFKEQYGKTIALHILESQKSKNKKSFMPAAINEFVKADKQDKNSVHVLLINAGMLNSKTLETEFDRTLFDRFTQPMSALAETKPFVIIDEPHRFAQANKTWKNIQKLKPQYILRFGATFKEYENLLYTLTAVDAFNQNLVKGVIAFIEEFKEGQNVYVELVKTNGKEATFKLADGNTKKTFKLSAKQELTSIHKNFTGLFIEKLNKSKVLLSNGLSLKKGNKINPYSYEQTLQERMIKRAVENHFKIEKELLTKSPRIKPLTLFFIDNIDEYRKKDRYLRKAIETHVKAIAENYLAEETNPFYTEYLQRTLDNIELIHGGYFSKDNVEKDDKIEKEINEILHDKEALLDLENPRRFIFSKWTLREGWDNPNVFQICKLRSSGSEISKLQEVGRGLRLPVNEYMSRVKDEQFYLNYFVDFTENDFVNKLINEINQKSNTISISSVPEELTEQMIKAILTHYSDKFKNEDQLLEFLDENNVITRSNKFKEGGFEYLKKHFPLIFNGVASNKIRTASQQKKKIRVRTGKYNELRELWEELNKKAVLEYKIENEEEFKELFKNFIRHIADEFNKTNLTEKKITLKVENKNIETHEEYITENAAMLQVITMTYKEFLKELAKKLKANPKTLHEVFTEQQTTFNINNYLNRTTIRSFQQGFNKFLFHNAIDKFGIGYQAVTHSVHPTKLTDSQGEPLQDINASDVGTFCSDEKVAESYYFEELFYDSELEKENIITNIEEVIVFTKIPKNSIKIPVAGGGTYSPDFAYVLKNKNGNKRLYFVVETKNIESKEEIRKEELKKIKHAEKFFQKLGSNIKFTSQFNNDKITTLIKNIYTSGH